LIVGGVLGEHFDLLGSNIAAEGFALLPPLEVIIRPIGTVAQDAEFARLHVLDAGDLLEQLSGLGSVRLLHERSICIYIYYNNQNSHFESFS
jgi:hypothetical protein